MRWGTLVIGTRRIKRRFLFFPKEINNEVRWLECAKWEEQYYYYLTWIPTRWID